MDKCNYYYILGITECGRFLINVIFGAIPDYLE